MKKIVISLVLLFFIGGMYAVAPVDVFYFHYTRRCTTCKAVESETFNALQQLYKKQIEAGVLKFTSVNLDEKSSEQIAEKCKADGQSLLIVSGKKRIDLTNSGFMYATNKPEKLKLELKKSINPLLK